MIALLRILFWPFIWLYKLLCGMGGFRGNPPDIVSPASGDTDPIAFPVSGTYAPQTTVTVTVAVIDSSGATVNNTPQNATAGLNSDWDTNAFSVTFPIGVTSCTCKATATGTGGAGANPVTFTVETNPPITMDQPPPPQPENDATTTASAAPTTHWSISFSGNSPGATTKATLSKKKGAPIDTLTLNNAGGKYSGIFQHVTKGIYRVHVEAVDKTGKTVNTCRKVRVG